MVHQNRRVFRLRLEKGQHKHDEDARIKGKKMKVSIKETWRDESRGQVL